MKAFKIVLTLVILLTGLITLNACKIESPIENYTWVLTSYGQPGSMKTPLADTELTAFFESETKQIKGNGGCNGYGGDYTVDGLSLSITGLISTLMSCGEQKDAQEQQFFKALQAAESFKMDHGNLIIYCGREVLNFSRK